MLKPKLQMAFNQGFLKGKIEGSGLRVVGEAEWFALVQASVVFLSLINLGSWRHFV